MEEVATIGLDIAKSVFQVHGIDAEGVVVVQRRLTRARVLPFFEKLAPCLVGIEASPRRIIGRGSCERAVIRYAKRHGSRRPWLVQLMARQTTKVAAVALANKTARVIWAIMTSGQPYREPRVAIAQD